MNKSDETRSRLNATGTTKTDMKKRYVSLRAAALYVHIYREKEKERRDEGTKRVGGYDRVYKCVTWFFLAMRWTCLIPRFTRTDNNVIADTLQAQVEKADKIIRATDRSELHGTKSYTCVLYVYG